MASHLRQMSGEELLLARITGQAVPPTEIDNELDRRALLGFPKRTERRRTRCGHRPVRLAAVA